MNDAMIRTIIDETIARAALLTPVPKILPGTVVNVEDPSLIDPTTVEVLMDGDEESIVGQSVIGAVPVGSRVMCTFNPPSGMIVTGLITTPYTAFTEVDSFLNSWTNFAAGAWTSARYRLELGMVVRLEGMIAGGVVGSPAFVLPEALWPSTGFTFAVDSANAHGRLDILPTGDVVPTTGSNTYFSLNCAFALD